MRRKRTTQIDFRRLERVDERPTPEDGAGKCPITESEITRGPTEVVVHDSGVIATASQQPAHPPNLTADILTNTQQVR